MAGLQHPLCMATRRRQRRPSRSFWLTCERLCQRPCRRMVQKQPTRNLLPQMDGQSGEHMLNSQRIPALHEEILIWPDLMAQRFGHQGPNRFGQCVMRGQSSDPKRLRAKAGD